MKKIFILILFAAVLLISTNAVAEEPICGLLSVQQITLFKSDFGSDVPVAPCLLSIEFFTENGQGPYIIPATAFGTQLNLALLKSFNFAEVVDACVELTIIPPNNFLVEVVQVTF